MTEPDVALTDFVLAVECLLFAILVHHKRMGVKGLRPWFSLFFISVSIASLCGGIVHGFFLDEQSWGSAILWPTTLVATGITALCAWAIGANLLFSKRVARSVISAAIIEFACYSVLIVFQTHAFWVAIANNVPAILFLFGAIVLEYRREKHWRVLLAAIGLALIVVAHILQQWRVAIHEEYFNHNALYHLLQAVALFMFYLGGSRLIERDRDPLRGTERT